MFTLRFVLHYNICHKTKLIYQRLIKLKYILDQRFNVKKVVLPIEIPNFFYRAKNKVVSDSIFLFEKEIIFYYTRSESNFDF